MEKAAGKGDMFGFEDDPGEDLAKLKRAWVNERNAPEILPYLEELMEDMKEQVRNQQHVADDKDGEGKALVANLLQMEVERVNFLLVQYHRVRLKKIERYILFLTTNQDAQQRLSAHEMTFAKAYLGMWEKQMKRQFTDHIPAKHQQLTAQSERDEINMVEMPDMQKHIFFEAHRDIGRMEGVEDQEVMKGDMFCLPYKYVESIVVEGGDEGDLC